MIVRAFIILHQCKHKMHLSESKVKYFCADILQYSPRNSHLTIYHCTAERLEMTCHETFFGHRLVKHRSLHTIPVTVKDCDKAMKLHKTCYGRLRKHSHAEWRTHTPDSYSCKWMNTKADLGVVKAVMRLMYVWLGQHISPGSKLRLGTVSGQ